MKPLSAAVAFLLAMLLAGCHREEKQQAASARQEGPPSVSVAPVVRADLKQETILTGELTPFQEVEVMAKVAGYVQSIGVDVGDFVRQGQVLATLEIPEMHDDIARASAAIEQTRADVKRAQDEVDRASKDYQIAHLRYSRLASVFKSQPGLVAQQEVDDAQSKEQVAQAQVSAAQSSLDSAREKIKVGEADRVRAQTLLQYTRVVAPFDGVITKRYANNGSMIQAGVASQSQAMPVVRLSQNSRLRLVLDVPESAAALVRTGSSVQVRIPSKQREFVGRVSRTAERVSSSTRTMHTEVDVANGDRELIPGMYAEVTLRLADRPHALAIPLSAVKGEGESREALIVTNAGKVESRRVRCGIATATFIETLDGLSEGEQVILGPGRAQVKEGQTVRPVPVKSGGGA